MKKIQLTHTIYVPNNKTQITKADGYEEELSEVTTYQLSEEEYESLREAGGLFDLFDCAFGTMIDDFEEDRIESQDIPQATEMTRTYIDSHADQNLPGAWKVLESLEYAKKVGVFWEIINRAELVE